MIRPLQASLVGICGCCQKPVCGDINWCMYMFEICMSPMIFYFNLTKYLSLSFTKINSYYFFLTFKHFIFTCSAYYFSFIMHDLTSDGAVGGTGSTDTAIVESCGSDGFVASRSVGVGVQSRLSVPK